MKILLVGTGMMGQRHISSLFNNVKNLDLVIYDKNNKTLQKIKSIWGEKIGLYANSLEEINDTFDGAVISTNAKNRKEIIRSVLEMGVKNLLIEKPVEQSLERFYDTVKLFDNSRAKGYVNFTRRCFDKYEYFYDLINNAPQFKGKKVITILGGALGIGCNGIHLIDLVIKLLDPSSYKIKMAQISDEIVLSGRGKEFTDFGGKVLIEFYDMDKNMISELFIFLASYSSAPSFMSILGKHARVDIDEAQGKYKLTMRKPDSKLPVYRYYGDYDGVNTFDLNLPDLDVGVKEWLKSFQGEKIRLPEVRDTSMAHKIIFEWLGYSKKYKGVFPIT